MVFTVRGHLSAHRILCPSNPNAAANREKAKLAGEARRGTPLTESARANIAKGIQAKVLNGTWHNSFSRARTIEYNGVKFYGSWEVGYAKWLDAQGIAWRRPTESFAYEFEGYTRRYTPDFYLLDEGCYVEVKGCPTPKDFAKWDCFPLKLRILTGRMLRDLGIDIEFRPLDREYRDISWK